MIPPNHERRPPEAPRLDRGVPASLLRRKWITPVVGLLIVLILFGLKSDHFSFLSATNQRFIAAQAVQVGVCAIGMTFIMIGGGIDLSVGSVMALTCVTVAVLMRSGHSAALAIAAAIAVGLLCGLVNALLVTGLRIIPFVATLGTLSACRGLARLIADNQVVRLKARPDALADFVLPIGQTTILGLAPAVWVMLAAALVAGIILNYTAFGRRAFAIGSNEQAARLSGVRVNRNKICLYAIGGALTGLAGVFLFANTSEGDPTAAVGVELSVIAAVVIGGGSLMGGEGSVLGTIVGAFMLAALINGCTIAGWPNYVQEIIIGAIIVAAVALDYFRRRAPV